MSCSSAAALAVVGWHSRVRKRTRAGAGTALCALNSHGPRTRHPAPAAARLAQSLVQQTQIHTQIHNCMRMSQPPDHRRGRTLVAAHAACGHVRRASEGARLQHPRSVHNLSRVVPFCTPLRTALCTPSPLTMLSPALAAPHSHSSPHHPSLRKAYPTQTGATSCSLPRVRHLRPRYTVVSPSFLRPAFHRGRGAHTSSLCSPPPARLSLPALTQRPRPSAVCSQEGRG